MGQLKIVNSKLKLILELKKVEKLPEQMQKGIPLGPLPELSDFLNVKKWGIKIIYHTGLEILVFGFCSIGACA